MMLRLALVACVMLLCGCSGGSPDNGNPRAVYIPPTKPAGKTKFTPSP